MHCFLEGDENYKLIDSFLLACYKKSFLFGQKPSTNSFAPFKFNLGHKKALNMASKTLFSKRKHKYIQTLNFQSISLPKELHKNN